MKVWSNLQNISDQKLCIDVTEKHTILFCRNKQVKFTFLSGNRINLILNHSVVSFLIYLNRPFEFIFLSVLDWQQLPCN